MAAATVACTTTRATLHTVRDVRREPCRLVEMREAELLPVPYFHVVFTLPHQLTQLCSRISESFFIVISGCGRNTGLVAANPKHLGVRIGILSVLHSWGQNLMAHPHVHSIVTGGGLSLDGSQWISLRRKGKRGPKFLLPVRVFSRVFRGKFIYGLKEAFAQGKLEFHGQMADVAAPHRFEDLLNSAVRRDWVVYAKRPFGGPEQVLKYLGDTRTAWPFPIHASSVSAMVESRFVTRTMRIKIKPSN